MRGACKVSWACCQDRGRPKDVCLSVLTFFQPLSESVRVDSVRSGQPRLVNELEFGRIGAVVRILIWLYQSFLPLQCSEQRILDDIVHPWPSIDLQQNTFQAHTARAWDTAARAER